MIVKLKQDGSIDVIKDTIENTSRAYIKIEAYRNLYNGDRLNVFINNKELSKASDLFILDNEIIKNGENLLEVVWTYPNGQSKSFSLITNMQTYFSLGDHRIEDQPQVIINLLSKIDRLEKRIEKLEERGTII